MPRDPSLGPRDQPHLLEAVKTWDPKGDWSEGGGGHPWDGMAYDPALDLLYIGTGNGAPWNARDRSPDGSDNLYLSSIVAVSASSGRYRWHFQTTPWDHWDYTATSRIVLAHLQVDGRVRKVLMQAPKNGHFYVLDRETGQFISGSPISRVTWTTGLDPKTGRPEINSRADWNSEPRIVAPGPGGARSWHPMSFNPDTGLVYLAVSESQDMFVDTRGRPIGRHSDSFHTYIFPGDGSGFEPERLRPMYGDPPSAASVAASSSVILEPAQTWLRAWDPIARKVVWQLKEVEWAGVTSTAGDLVMFGDRDGHLNFVHSRTGERLHRVRIGPELIGAPMTYRISGVQYVAIIAGGESGSAARLVVLRLGGGDVPPPAPGLVPREPSVVRESVSATTAELLEGRRLYETQYQRCHQRGGIYPDLVTSVTYLDQGVFHSIVQDGSTRGEGHGTLRRFLNSASDRDCATVLAVIGVGSSVVRWLSRRGDHRPWRGV